MFFCDILDRNSLEINSLPRFVDTTGFVDDGISSLLFYSFKISTYKSQAGDIFALKEVLLLTTSETFSKNTKLYMPC